MALNLTPDGLTGFGIELYNGSFSWTTSAQTIYQHNNGYLLETAPYLLTIQISGSPWYSESWSGIMQWYGASTNSNDATTIYLTGSGHAPNGGVPQARFRRVGGNNNTHGLQVWSNHTGSYTTKVYATKLSTQGW